MNVKRPSDVLNTVKVIAMTATDIIRNPSIQNSVRCISAERAASVWRSAIRLLFLLESVVAHQDCTLGERILLVIAIGIEKRKPAIPTHATKLLKSMNVRDCIIHTSNLIFVNPALVLRLVVK